MNSDSGSDSHSDSKTKHNLDIHMYSLKEIFELFDIHNQGSITIEQLKTAKKKVLYLHPDKSKLSPDYFLFYKKAFDIIVKFYENQNKQNQKIDETTTKYDTKWDPSDNNRNNTKNIKRAIGELSTKDFNSKFNQLFESNMSKKIDPTKNEWFSNQSETFDITEPVTQKNMGHIINKIKEQQNGMVLYRGVENMTGSIGTNLYEEDEDGHVSAGTYVSSDPFSKLKFDDLRKVHKDQTVFVVSENDFHKVKQYSNVEQFVRDRNSSGLEPISKVEAERMLVLQNKQYEQQIREKEYLAELRTQKNGEKNKAILSNFLRIGL